MSKRSLIFCLNVELCGDGANIFISVPFALPRKLTSQNVNEINFGISNTEANFIYLGLKEN